MKKAETASDIKMSRSQPEIAGFNRFEPAAETAGGSVAPDEEEGGKTVELFSSGTDFILLV